MSTENLSIGLALVLSGALIIAACVPLLHDRIKPNAFYGIRLPKSFESQENWFKMNRFGARQMILWASVMMAFGLLAFFLPLQGHKNLTVLVATIPGLLLLAPLFSKTL